MALQGTSVNFVMSLY
ncbi:Protein of unknown function [Bacillus cereus]|nr:Protein of unknown function [Bacillus wiedmannii]SCN39477.1 Protein of unknown function [Bacillus cereus]